MLPYNPLYHFFLLNATRAYIFRERGFATLPPPLSKNTDDSTDQNPANKNSFRVHEIIHYGDNINRLKQESGEIYMRKIYITKYIYNWVLLFVLGKQLFLHARKKWNSVGRIWCTKKMVHLILCNNSILVNCPTRLNSNSILYT